EESTGIAPKDLKYRFAWTFPLAFSPHDANVLYAGGNHVFRTRDEGITWEEISPDLSLNEKSRQGHSGGDITHESAGAEVHATCASIAPSPHRKGEIWASTDDGLVHVTRDDGRKWKNVTPKGMPELAYVGCVEVSPHDADTVYVAATRYKLQDYAAYLFRTTDGGKSCTAINGDFPAGEITRVVRADPVRPGLLFAGTETGVFFTLDDGKTWTRLRGGLPVVPVYDLKIKGADLIAGTHGRSFWVLDDISPLRALADGKTQTRLIAPRTTIRSRMRFGALGGVKRDISFALVFGIGGGIATVEKPDGTKVREHLDVGENPPGGAIVYYWLGPDADGKGPLSLTFRDAKGAEILTVRSDDTSLTGGKRPRTKPGLNRNVWDRKHPGPVQPDPSLAAARTKPGAAEHDAQSGPLAVPGDYRVELKVGGATLSAEFSIVKDPRLATPLEAHVAQFALLQELTGALSRLNAGVNRIRRL